MLCDSKLRDSRDFVRDARVEGRFLVTTRETQAQKQVIKAPPTKRPLTLKPPELSQSAGP